MAQAEPLQQDNNENLARVPVIQAIEAMARALSGSSLSLWYPAASMERRELICISRHNADTLEVRAQQTVHWLFALFNVDFGAKRFMDKFIAKEFSELVENHYILWKEFEGSPYANMDDPIIATTKRRLAYSHEVIYKCNLLWQRLQDILLLHAVPEGNLYDASVPSEMRLSYDRAYEMRAMLSDPAPVLLEERSDHKKRDMEILVTHLLEQARANRFRKRGNVVYEQKHVLWRGARYSTCAWAPACFGSQRGGTEEHSIESFVLYFCKKDLYPEMHAALLRCLPVRKVAEFLYLCDESDFPFVSPRRTLFSFRNGVYDSSGAGLGEFHEYGAPSMARIAHLAAAKYFDTAMPSDAYDTLRCRASGWWDIPTPLFQSAQPPSSKNLKTLLTAGPYLITKNGGSRRIARAPA